MSARVLAMAEGDFAANDHGLNTFRIADIAIAVTGDIALEIFVAAINFTGVENGDVCDIALTQYAPITHAPDAGGVQRDLLDGLFDGECTGVAHKVAEQVARIPVGGE